MKISSLITVFILLLSINLLGQQDESVLNKKISIHIIQQPISKILSQITQDEGIYFSFDASVVATNRVESIKAHNQPLKSILNQLFGRRYFNFVARQNQIIISFKQQVETVINPVVESPKNQSIKLSGKVIDAKKNKTLPFASVSIYNKPIGTITNADGEYELKIDPENTTESIIVSCLGYAQKITTIEQLLLNSNVELHPISIKIKEVSVKAIKPNELLDKVLENIRHNYGTEMLQMTGFYREVIRQDENLINISEAVLDLLKSPYQLTNMEDKVRIQKGRKTPDINPFELVSFKLQGGPHNMTMLDVLKTMDSYIDPEFRNIYDYTIDRVIWYHNHPAYVLKFEPNSNVSFPCYEGEMYINRETYAIMHANFSLGKWGLDLAEQSLIMKKPRGFKVKPQSVKYTVDYTYNLGRWHFNFARASIKFKVKDRREKINSIFHSVSELLVTDVEKSKIKRFPKKEEFSAKSIFIETITDYDPEFWGDFNIIKPEQNLKTALINFSKINSDKLNLLNNHDNLSEKSSKP